MLNLVVRRSLYYVGLGVLGTGGSGRTRPVVVADARLGGSGRKIYFSWT